MSPRSESGNLPEVWRYYDRTESRIGYRFLLNGTKHFGLYETGESKWRFERAMRRTEEKLADVLNLGTDAQVLDAGCGMGDVSRTLATHYGLRVTGIDILDFNLEEAKARADKAGLNSRVVYTWGDYHHLEFSNNSFDGVYTMETLVHASDPRQALSEFWRVLRPGGRLALFEYSRRHDQDLEPAALRALEEVCTQAAMPAWLEFTDGTLEGLLEQVGFIEIRSEDLTQQMLPMVHAFSIIGSAPLALMRRLNKAEKAVNAMSGVEMYKYRGSWSYKAWTATKPS